VRFDGVCGRGAYGYGCLPSSECGTRFFLARSRCGFLACMELDPGFKKDRLTPRVGEFPAAGSAFLWCHAASLLSSGLQFLEKKGRPGYRIPRLTAADRQSRRYLVMTERILHGGASQVTNLCRSAIQFRFRQTLFSKAISGKIWKCQFDGGGGVQHGGD